MCLSHYGHLNEYSHVLAEKFMAVIKCKKKKFKKCEKLLKYFKRYC